MAVRLHWHRWQQCGTKCDSSCEGRGREASCGPAPYLPNREAPFGCVHVVGEKAERSGLASDATPSEHAYVNADGDTISVRSWEDGTSVTACTNGTATVRTPDGTSQSVNDPLGGSPIYVTIDPGGTRTTEFPNGKTETVFADGSTRVVDADGTATTVQPDGKVSIAQDGQPPAAGLTLDEAIHRGALSDVQVVSTGENMGTVAVLVGSCDGSVPFVYVPAGIVTPDDAVTNQTMDTHPAVIDTATPGPIEAELPGACRNDPALPPAPSGDVGVSLAPTPGGDPTVHIPDIVQGAVGQGTIPGDLVGTPEDTARTMDQVTRWLRQGTSPQEVVAFLLPRIPGSEGEKEAKAQEITDWGARLVDKTRNLDKQVADAPEVPPTLLA